MEKSKEKNYINWFEEKKKYETNRWKAHTQTHQFHAKTVLHTHSKILSYHTHTHSMLKYTIERVILFFFFFCFSK